MAECPWTGTRSGPSKKVKSEENPNAGSVSSLPKSSDNVHLGYAANWSSNNSPLLELSDVVPIEWEEIDRHQMKQDKNKKHAMTNLRI